MPLHDPPVKRKQEGLLRQKNQLDAYVAWHRQQGLAPTLDEMMGMPSTNERWSQEGTTGNLKGAPKVTVILNLFMREVRDGALVLSTVWWFVPEVGPDGGEDVM